MEARHFGGARQGRQNLRTTDAYRSSRSRGKSAGGRRGGRPHSSGLPGEMYTDSQGMQPHSPPRPMTDSDIAHVVSEYSQSARLALEAGFDGVELHGANGYLIEQFLNPIVNTRGDAYGMGIEGRNRLAIEIARAAAGAIGPDRVGIRLSPYGVFNGTGEFPEAQAQYLAGGATLGSSLALCASRRSLRDGRAARAGRFQT